jgi:hypothetical protein
MATKKTKEITPKLVSFTMKAIIPTGVYANIQPEITVEAETLEQANNYVMPYIESLYAKYLNFNEKPIQPSHKVCATPAPTAPAPVQPTTPSPAQSVSFIKATQAVNSCTTKEALSIVENQINVSNKLSNKEKAELLLIVESKTFNE